MCACYVAGTYAYLFWVKSRNAGRPRWGIFEMMSEVIGQFVATAIAVGEIFICNDNKYSGSSVSVLLSMISLVSVDGFELILTLITIPFMDSTDERSFDETRWEQLNGCSMFLVRFLIWCIGSGLPLVIFFFQFMSSDNEEHIAVRITCYISLGIGMMIGFLGQCMIRNPNYIGRGTFMNWVLIKWFVGIIPGLILAIVNKNWIALGWGAEVFIEISHYFGLFSCA